MTWGAKVAGINAVRDRVEKAKRQRPGEPANGNVHLTVDGTREPEYPVSCLRAPPKPVCTRWVPFLCLLISRCFLEINPCHQGNKDPILVLLLVWKRPHGHHNLRFRIPIHTFQLFSNVIQTFLSFDPKLLIGVKIHLYTRSQIFLCWEV